MSVENKLRVLVIGGGGFIGQHLVENLLRKGHEVRNLDLVPNRFTHPALSHWPGSFLQPELLREAITGIDTIYHLAATAMPRESNLDPYRDCVENIAGTISILQTAEAIGVQRIIFSSSGGTVYGSTETVPIPEEHQTNPITAYGISKLACEKYLRLYNKRGNNGRLNTLSLRIANPYGPRQNIKTAQGALTTFCYNTVAGLPITIWGDGSVERDFIHISDVVHALYLAGTSDVSATEINIGSGCSCSLNHLLDLIGEIEGREIPRRYDLSRSFDVRRNHLDIRRAKELLDWEPQVPLQQGIAELLGYFHATLASEESQKP